MSSTAAQWLPVILFLVLFVVCVGFEAAGLTRKGWASSGTASVYVLLTDILAFAIAGAALLGISLGLFMLVMGPSGRGSTAPDAAYIALVAVGVATPVIVTFLVKLIFLYLLKIRSGKPALLYALAISVILPVAIFAPPAALFYLFTTFN